jgi:uncharacterized membrane protein
MTLFEMVRNLRVIDQSYTDAINAVATAVDRLGEQLNLRIEQMATNLQQALAAVRAEVEDERNVFIGAVKLLQAQADQVKAAADAAVRRSNVGHAGYRDRYACGRRTNPRRSERSCKNAGIGRRQVVFRRR